MTNNTTTTVASWASPEGVTLTLARERNAMVYSGSNLKPRSIGNLSEADALKQMEFRVAQGFYGNLRRIH